MAAGLVADGRIIAALSRVGASHARDLTTLIDNVLERAGVPLAEVRGVAVGLGPGSFTGLRIALSYAKGLAFAGGCEVIGVASLDALALCAVQGLNPSTPWVCPVLDARKGQIYAALYRWVSAGLHRQTGDLLVTPAQLIDRLQGKTLLVGEALVPWGGSLEAKLGQLAQITSPAAFTMRGAMVAALGAAALAQGQSDSWRTLQPRYVRSPDGVTRAETVV